MSAPAQTPSTPGIALAAAVSMLLMMPWACGERTIQAKACPGRLKSSVYLPLPRTSVSSSLRRTGCPTPNFCSAIAVSRDAEEGRSCIEGYLKCRILRDFGAYHPDNVPISGRQRLIGHGPMWRLLRALPALLKFPRTEIPRRPDGRGKTFLINDDTRLRDGLGPRASPPGSAAAGGGAQAEPASGSGVYAALDLGTHNFRLLIACPTRGGVPVVDSFSRIIRLGGGISAT